MTRSGNSGQPRSATQKPDRAKLKGLAIALPVFGTILLVPPLTQIFVTKGTIFGVPLIVFYLFSIWIVLIGASFLISRKITDTDEPTEPASSETGDA